MNEVRPGSRKRTNLVIAAVLLAAVGCLAMTWHLTWQGGVALGPLHLRADAINFQSTLTSTATSFSSDQARADSRRIVVLDEDGSPLSQKITAAVAEELRKCFCVQEIDVGGKQIRRGQQLPGLTIRLRLERIEESDGFLERKLKVRLLGVLCTGAALGPCGYHEGGFGPQFEGQWDFGLNHESTSRGDGVGGDRYRLTGREIGKRFGETLRKTIEEWVQKQGAAPQMPAEFFGPFRENDDLNFLREQGAVEIVAGTSLLTHLDSAWRWSDSRPPQEVIEKLIETLQGRGWRVLSKSEHGKGSGPAYAWLQTGDKYLNAFEERNPFAATFVPSDGASKSPPAAGVFWVHYRDRFSSDERQKAVATLLSPPGRIREAGRFINLMSAEQLQQYFAQIETSKSATADDWLCLTQYHRTKDRDKAAKELRRAVVLTALDENAANLRSRAEDLAKKLGDMSIVKRKIADRELAELEIPVLDKPIERDVDVDEPVVGWATCDKQPYFAQASVVRLGGREFQFRYRLGAATGSGASSGKQSGVADPSGMWHAETNNGYNQFSVRMQAKQIGPERFRVRLEKSR